MWAILTHPAKKGAGWDPEEFFQTGVWEIGEALRHVESHYALPARRRALDFGCGVGRLTQALAEHFEQVWGVDISPSMIQRAGQYNRRGERCHYILNERTDLRVLEDRQFDFIYSSITLQHMPPRFSRRYIAEFLRLLAPGGVLLFQLTSRRRKSESFWQASFRQFYYRVLWDFLQPETPLMEMYAVPREEVLDLIREHGGEILDVRPDPAAEPDWEGFRYLVTRRE